MAQYFTFVCSSCRRKYNIINGDLWTDIRPDGSNETYERVVEKLLAEDYGKEWKKLFSSTPLAVIDIERKLYVSETDSKVWEDQLDLSLYVPNDPDGISAAKDRSLHKYGHLPGAPEVVLERDYKLLKEYEHIRDGEKLQPVKVGLDFRLTCPECGMKMAVNDWGDW